MLRLKARHNSQKFIGGEKCSDERTKLKTVQTSVKLAMIQITAQQKLARIRHAQTVQKVLQKHLANLPQKQANKFEYVKKFSPKKSAK